MTYTVTPTVKMEAAGASVTGIPQLSHEYFVQNHFRFTVHQKHYTKDTNIKGKGHPTTGHEGPEREYLLFL